MYRLSRDFLHLLRGERVPFDMEDVLIIPLKTGNDHKNIVARCIYESLHRTQQEPGRVPYHPAQLRGFLSNRVGGKESDKERSEVKATVKGLTGAVGAAGKRTLGEYLASLPSPVSLRDDSSGGQLPVSPASHAAFRTLRADSAPKTGSMGSVNNPICFRTEA